MLSLLFAVALVLPQAKTVSDAAAVVREAAQAIPRGTERRLETAWLASVRRDPADRRALLGLATIARLTYQYDRADSLYLLVLARGPASPNSYSATARLGMAIWRSLGTERPRADSLYSLALAEGRELGDTRIVFDALMGLGQLRGRTVGPRVGLQLVREAMSQLSNGTAEDSANSRCTEGAHMEQLGDTAGARRLAEGTRIAARARNYRSLGNCELLWAQSRERNGLEGADTLAINGIQHFEQARYLVGAALASQWFGYVRFQQGSLASGRRNLEKAVRLAQATRFRSVEAWAHSGLASIHLTVGNVAAARQHAERAAVMHATNGDLWGLAGIQTFEGQLLESQQQLDAARQKYVDAIATYERAGLAYNSLVALRHLSLLDIRRGAYDSAERNLKEATRLARASGNSGWLAERPVHDARLAMARGELRSADSLLRLASSEQYDWRSEEAFSVVGLPFALLEAQLALRTQRVAVAESAITWVSLTTARWRSLLANAEMRTGIAQLRDSWGALSDVYPDIVDRLVRSDRLPLAFRFIESIRAREFTERALRSVARAADSVLARVEFARIPMVVVAAEVSDVRRQLGRDEALVSLTLGIDRGPTTAIVVTADTAFGVSLPARETLVPLIERYHRIAVAGTDPVSVSRELGAALITPIARALPPRVTRLLVSPDGDLFRVPFDALRLADDRYVVERFEVSLVPSATAALELRRTPSSGTTRVIAIGDPQYGGERGEPSRSGSGSGAADSALFGDVPLARLPRSAVEARRVAQYARRGEAWTRAAASESAVRSADWSNVSVAHFATHALVDNEGQARTALALSPGGRHDGFLTTSEIASLRFAGSLIVLSACHTLGGQVLGGEGLRGLAGPLLEAGARAIVVTHWSIGDRSVVPFVDRYYAAMAAGASAGAALRSTKLAAIRDGARISDWAAFTIIGDGSMRPALRPRRLTPIDWLRGGTQPMRDTTGAGQPPAGSPPSR
jgi:CHAT domain-containing protein/tetratricopeptide (TPR) repeat protein